MADENSILRAPKAQRQPRNHHYVQQCTTFRRRIARIPPLFHARALPLLDS